MYYCCRCDSKRGNTINDATGSGLVCRHRDDVVVGGRGPTGRPRGFAARGCLVLTTNHMEPCHRKEVGVSCKHTRALIYPETGVSLKTRFSPLLSIRRRATSLLCSSLCFQAAPICCAGALSIPFLPRRSSPCLL